MPTKESYDSWQGCPVQYPFTLPKDLGLDPEIYPPVIFRKVSWDKTLECPVWDDFDQCWMESDDQLRERMKSSASE